MSLRELGDWLDRFLTPRRVGRYAKLIALVAVGALLLSYAVAKSGRTPLGTTLAADYPQFYVAGKILSDPGRDRLYDLQLQSRMQVKLFPGENQALPYAYPPLVAYVVRPLSYLPYEKAAAIWTICAALFYGVGLFGMWRACPGMGRAEKWLGVWICLAFEPFTFECLHGGQISTFAFACVCIAIWMDKENRPVLSGIAMGLLAYKPTLLAILLPAMALGRRWKMLGGCIATIGFGALLSLVIAGPVACGEFVRMIGTYGNAVAANDGFRTWKYVDLCAFLRLLHAPREMTVVLPMVGMAGAGIFLGLIQRSGADWDARAAIWAIALPATLIFNLYVAIYDSVLIVPAFWLAADWMHRREGGLTKGYRRLGAAVFLAPWISPGLARLGGFQIDTVVLGASLVYMCVVFQAILQRPARREALGFKSTDLEATSTAPNLPH
ncbi:MAG: glycosyltransferase family 87 protein [Tepidisphaeraceae bacterium]|jgi:hypothetical protein